MKSRLVIPLLALSISIAASCAGPKRMSQVQIGVWAAEHDLWAEAAYRWRRALETEPNSAIARNNLAVAYEKQGLFEEARREYELALKLAPAHVKIKANFQRFKLALESKDEKPPAKAAAEGKKDEIR
ncbi:MAG: hypothetical protein A2Y56_13105 [Candidatus Aminicenantes bacterium RBG_13_63_10]|nr:MAG: hypothetical protein A2Y56_13105 [Candidatus Aminicenantes bacterium RBG_13_63_10]